MTDEECANRNPRPERIELRLEDCPELFIKDLELRRVYILVGRTVGATLNFMGCVDTVVGMRYHFHGPRASVDVFLRERPDKSGTLEDGMGLKVTIRKYSGPDA